MENAACYAPQILVSTEDLPREQWLEYRRKGIGGSDAAAVLGISPFRTGRDLYYDKLNTMPVSRRLNRWVSYHPPKIKKDAQTFYKSVRPSQYAAMRQRFFFVRVR